MGLQKYYQTQRQIGTYLKKIMEKIKIHATVRKNANLVWDSYTKPEHIINWNFASDDWQCPQAENDLRVGGKYLARMEAKDGSFGFDFEAEYTTVDSGKSFTYVMPDGRVVEVKIEPSGEDSEITVVFDAENENPIDMQRDGWQAILNNFKNYTETLS